MKNGWVDTQIELIFEFVIWLKNEYGRAIPMSCGWCKENLSQLVKESKTQFQLKLEGGYPGDPTEIRPEDVKTGRKGIIASLGKMLGNSVKSFLNLKTFFNIEHNFLVKKYPPY